MSFEEIHDIEVSDIDVSEFNVRLANATKDLDELAASIREHGLLQPVILIGKFGSPPYKLIAGQRRLLAHQKLKRRTIPAVFAGEIGEDKAVLISLVENLQSVELNHADGARAISRLYEFYGKNERRVQKETGLSLRRIRDYLTIEAQASARMKDLLKRKKVTPADVKRALRAAQGQIKKAEKLLDLMTEYKLTRHQKRRVVEYGTTHTSASAKKILDEAVLPRVEESILVSLPEDVRQGLEKATKDLEQEVEEIVTEVLHEWLREQGFIDE